MSEMVERVARAICASQHFGPASEVWVDGNWARYETAALASIEAMRRPTETMAIAGRKHSLRPAVTWASMVDAALAPPRPLNEGERT